MISRPRLFCDIDNTITSSTEAFCTTYSEIYKDHPDYIPPIWQNVNKWDFADELPLLKGVKEVEEIFGKRDFFNNLKFINHNTYVVLRELNKKYEIILISIGSFSNIKYKTMWVDTNLPFITEAMFLVNKNCKMDKSLLNAVGKGNVFIDDVESNLKSVTTVERRICFGVIKSWNENWQGERALNWTDIANKLL